MAAEKQRQEVGVTRLAPDLWQLRLPLPFRLRLINVYLARGKDGYALMDTGIGTPECEEAFDAGLREIGVRSQEITTVLVTHMHPDHIGLAGRRAAFGARAFIMKDEERRARHVWGGGALEDWVSFLRHHGTSRELAEGVIAAAASLRKVVSLPDAFEHLTDGDQVLLGERRCRVMWTPGHSDFHYVLVDDERAAIFAGDHILPEITPNIGLYPQCRPNPLADYLWSLRRFDGLGRYTVLPAHGPVFAALPARLDELRKHHEERLRGMQDRAVDPSGVTSMDVVRHFWGDTLSPHEIRFALVEVAAHLEYLRIEGNLVTRDIDGVVRYSRARSR